MCNVNGKKHKKEKNNDRTLPRVSREGALMARDSGFYWVKRHGVWVVAEYIQSEGRIGHWLLTGHEDDGYFRFTDRDFDEIDGLRLIKDL